MKVLVISHTYITRINRDKWKEVAKLHPDSSLTIVFPKSWPGNLYEHKAENLQEDALPNCTFIALDAFYMGNEMLYGYYPIALFKLLKTVKPQVIHVEQGTNALSYFETVVLAKLARVKAKFSFFTWINWKPNHRWKYRYFWRWIERFNLRISSGAIVGNHDAKILLEEQGFNKHITIAPQLGVNLEIFRPATLTTLPKTKTICYIGRITEEKGIMLLAHAFLAIANKFPDWQLQFVGTGKSEKKLIDFFISNKLFHRVEFNDPVPHDKISIVLRRSQILVLPSYDTPNWREQFGHVLIEAMACKIATLGSTGGEIPYVIGQAGMIFQQKNLTALISKLTLLMSDNNLRKQLAEKGYERVKAHYSNKKIAEQTYNFWKTMLYTATVKNRK